MFLLLDFLHQIIFSRSDCFFGNRGGGEGGGEGETDNFVIRRSLLKEERCFVGSLNLLS